MSHEQLLPGSLNLLPSPHGWLSLAVCTAVPCTCYCVWRKCSVSHPARAVSCWCLTLQVAHMLARLGVFELPGPPPT